MRLLILFYLSTFALLMPARGQSPTAIEPGVSVRFVSSASIAPVRMGYDSSSDVLMYVTALGEVYALDSPFIGQAAQLVYTPSDHGLASSVLGFATGADGSLYLVGNRSDGANTIAEVMKGLPDGTDGHNWSLLAATEPYPRSATPFDHLFNGMIVSPDGAHLYLNSGSRTDHGELQTNGNAFPGLREAPITSAILRLPADSSGMIIPNNTDSLTAKGFLFADGVRNSFDFAFDADGNLFATENSGDRDDAEEINWIREGFHYGFPWRMGTNDTPQQFSPYDPSMDLLINPNSFSSSNGFFYDDPTYPPVPENVVFMDPISNAGPDANSFRDPVDGTVKDADVEGAPVASLTPHRSPLGLVFDTDTVLPPGFAGDAFVLSWTGPSSDLLGPFGDEGEDMLQLSLVSTGDNYEMSTRRIVTGFDNPIDAVLVDDRIYVLEYGGDRGIWEISFADVSGIEPASIVQELNMSFYPNPVQQTGTLSIETINNSFYVVDLYDMMGRKARSVFHGVIPGSQVMEISIDVTGLASGLYFLTTNGGSHRQVLPVVVVD